MRLQLRFGGAHFFAMPSRRRDTRAFVVVLVLTIAVLLIVAVLLAVVLAVVLVVALVVMRPSQAHVL
jgi:hypothetical protein